MQFIRENIFDRRAGPQKPVSNIFDAAYITSELAVTFSNKAAGVKKCSDLYGVNRYGWTPCIITHIEYVAAVLCS